MVTIPQIPRTAPIDPRTGATSREWARYYEDLRVYLSTLPNVVTSVFGRSGAVLAAAGDYSVSKGGTGATSFTDGGPLLGSGTGAITAMAVLGDGAIVVGDGVADPVPITAFTSSTGTLTSAKHFTATTANKGAVKEATAIADLNQTITAPPTQGEVQDISDKIDALLAVMRTAGQLST
ncbi:hypothetical protein LCGC14_0355170 [marine sediment metagenome]|uniref:Uncharacterized protein n=1 Tax=marine sediment metagenome TaxID=412755 RepID=A0A0F9TSM1_9ZZZZ